MAKYLCMVRSGLCASELNEEEMNQVVERYMAWASSPETQKRLLSSSRLLPGEGRVVNARTGAVTDGPYAETKEVIGGYWLIEADSYEHAIELTAGIPITTGTLEIRRQDDD